MPVSLCCPITRVPSASLAANWASTDAIGSTSPRTSTSFEKSCNTASMSPSFANNPPLMTRFPTLARRRSKASGMRCSKLRRWLHTSRRAAAETRRTSSCSPVTSASSSARKSSGAWSSARRWDNNRTISRLPCAVSSASDIIRWRRSPTESTRNALRILAELPPESKAVTRWTELWV